MFAVSLTDFSSANVSALAIGCLAVVGGFLAGYVIGMFAAKAFDKLVVHRESPPGLHKIIKYTCALIVAIIVGLLVFRSGGGNGTGDNGGGGGTNPGENTNGTGTHPTTASTSGTPATKPEDNSGKIQIADPVKVRIHFGNDVEANTENYFQVDDNPIKTDLAGIKAAVRGRRLTAKGRVVIVYEFAPTASERLPPWAVLNGAKDSLDAPLLSPNQYQELLTKQP